MPRVLFQVTGSPGLLDSTSYQSPVQRDRRSPRKSQEGTPPLSGTIGEFVAVSIRAVLKWGGRQF